VLPEVGLILILHVALMLRTKANPNSASYGPAIAGVEIAPLTPSIGAVVSSVGLAHDLQDPTIEATIKQAFLDHQVLVFRDQELTRKQHQDFGRRFGRLHVHPSQCHDGYEGDQEIFPVEADEATVLNNGGL
jgi:taurine dioxygenase